MQAALFPTLPRMPLPGRPRAPPRSQRCPDLPGGLAKVKWRLWAGPRGRREADHGSTRSEGRGPSSRMGDKVHLERLWLRAHTLVSYLAASDFPVLAPESGGNRCSGHSLPRPGKLENRVECAVKTSVPPIPRTDHLPAPWREAAGGARGTARPPGSSSALVHAMCPLASHSRSRACVLLVKPERESHGQVYRE